MVSARKKDFRIAVLPGDGIGEEVMPEALKVLDAVARQVGCAFEYHKGLVGGAGFERHGVHFPKETELLCRESDAILFGSVGGPNALRHLPKWNGCEANSILAIRQAFKFNTNLRPARVYPALEDFCPLRRELIVDGIDVLVVRELLGDLYFGEKSSFTRDGERVARDIGEYAESQIRNVAEKAFQAARLRKKRVASVDKANVLEMSRLWRTVVTEVAGRFPDVELEHLFVDNCAMQLVKQPARFDVVLTSNLFGDILSDLAAILPGSLGLVPSASLNPNGFGLYEPAGGSAPEIAGQGIANPIAQILSAAMMLEYSFGMIDAARIIERAVERTLNAGYRTRDIAVTDSPLLTTAEMGFQIVQALADE